MKGTVMKFRKHRWSDNQAQWGPFVLSKETYGRNWSIVLDSGEPEYHGCSIRLRGFGWTLISSLPPIIRPWREKHFASKYAPSGGEGFYYEEHARQFGFNLSDGNFRIYYGAQTHDSLTDMNKGWSVPWLNWRFHRFSLYDQRGEHVWTQLAADRPRRGSSGFDQYEKQREATDACPKMVFNFLDYDSEPITATTHIEEYEHRFGEGRFKWLSLFRKPKIRRSLDIRFSKEVGPKKGSWKGGTMGHGIELQPGELHISAFGRYCGEHNLTLLMPLPEAA